MSDRAEAFAVIIARAGSKGLPGKNARMLAGRPMIAHSIAHARAARCIARIVVTTDGESIAEAARIGGVDVVDRPSELADDHATVDSAVRHAVESIDDDANIIVILYGNVPIRPDGLIDQAVETLVRTGADSVQSYAGVGKYHPQWMVRLDDDQRVTPYESSRVYRRQDLPAVYIPDGGVIAVRRDALFTINESEPHAFLGNDRRGIVNQPGAVIDIDSETDFRIAEAKIGRNSDRVGRT